MGRLGSVAFEGTRQFLMLATVPLSQVFMEFNMCTEHIFLKTIG